MPHSWKARYSISASMPATQCRMAESLLLKPPTNGSTSERPRNVTFYVSICVTDTGTGMPPDVIARAFDPFFTTKPIGQGTGLGLSMIFGFVQQSGGYVLLSSEEGHGTIVSIYLPHHCGVAEGRDGIRAATPRTHAEVGTVVLL